MEISPIRLNTKTPGEGVVGKAWNIRDECFHFNHFKENSPQAQALPSLCELINHGTVSLSTYYLT